MRTTLGHVMTGKSLLFYSPALLKYFWLKSDEIVYSLNGLVEHFECGIKVFSILVTRPVENPIIELSGVNFFVNDGRIYTTIHQYCNNVDITDEQKMILILKFS